MSCIFDHSLDIFKNYFEEAKEACKNNNFIFDVLIHPDNIHHIYAYFNLKLLLLLYEQQAMMNGSKCLSTVVSHIEEKKKNWCKEMFGSVEVHFFDR